MRVDIELPIIHMKKRRIAIFFYQPRGKNTLSYQQGWPRAFKNSNYFDCLLVNLADITFVEEFSLASVLKNHRIEVVALLHSVFSNQQNLKRAAFLSLSISRIPIVFFIGNEYKLMPEKMKFCRRLGIKLLISQSNDPEILGLYKAALNCSVESLPNTGFDPSIFTPGAQLENRMIDIGYRAYEGPWYLGNEEKIEIADLFLKKKNKYGLVVDISMAPKKRFTENEYANFLNKCRGQIGTESGGDYFELNDSIRQRVNSHLASKPNTSFTEIRALYFDHLPEMPKMRIISGRQVEAAACKTIQILYRGKYGGFFEADEHYIALNKDHSNIDEVVERFRDDAYCERITSNAYEVATYCFTYDKLLKKFSRMLNQNLF